MPAEPDAPAPPVSGLRAVITDWGGVLTSSIAGTVDAWIEAESIDRAAYLEVMRPWVHRAYRGGNDDNPVHRLERGEGDPEEFERQLAARLVRTDGVPVEASGLLARMFAANVTVPAMYDLMRAVRTGGFRTCLLSNSWGHGGYPREDFPELFDYWVISAEVGMRKPEERIFRHAAERLGLPPDQCVFIDDLEANVEAAVALGMTGVHHRDPADTAARLASLLALPPPGANQPARR